MKAISAMGLALMLVSASFYAEPAVPRTNTAEAEATRACSMGAASPRYTRPAEACWASFHFAFDKQDYTRAIQSVRNGCYKHHRSDHCMFIAHMRDQRVRIFPSSATADRQRFAQALTHAAQRVTARDVEDAEIAQLTDTRNSRSAARVYAHVAH